MANPLTVCIIINCGKLLKRWEYQTILPVPWETCMWVKKQQLELCMEQLIGSGLRKEHGRPACCHPVYLTYTLSFPGGSDCNIGYLGSIPGSGISPGEGNGNPLHYSWLENSMNIGAWRATVHGLVKSWARLSEVMRNASLDESQAGIKIGRRNINNLRYADHSTLMA